MKLIKYTLSALFAMAVVTSCSDKGYYDVYTPEGAEYSFEQAEFESLWTAGEEPETIDLTVVRNTSAGEAEVKLALTTDYSSNISVPASVKFADGSRTATFPVSIKDLTVGEEFVATVSLVDCAVSAGGSGKCDMSLALDYNWVSLGKGQFIDQFFMDDIYEVEIVKADGFPLYRVMKPYTEWAASEQAANDWEGWLAGPYVDYIEFWEATAAGEAVLNWQEYSSGLVYQGEAGAYIGVYPPYRLGKPMSNCCWVDEGIASFAPYYYITGVGGWDKSGSLGMILIALPGYSLE